MQMEKVKACTDTFTPAKPYFSNMISTFCATSFSGLQITKRSQIDKGVKLCAVPSSHDCEKDLERLQFVEPQQALAMKKKNQLEYS